MNCLQGISISKAVPEPEINLPSSITISRVDSDIQIVEEHIKPTPALAPAPPRLAGTTVVTRGGRGASRGRVAVTMRGRGGVRPPMMGRGMMMSRGRGGVINGYGVTGLRGRGGMVRGRASPIAVNSPVKRMMPSPVRSPARPLAPLKRMAGVLNSPMAAKRPRLPGSFINNMTGAVNPARLDPIARLCRVCGQESSVIFYLKDKPETVTRVRRILNISLDLEADKEAGYPAVVCRKCCNLLETFATFRRSVNMGQESLTQKVEAARQRKQAR